MNINDNQLEIIQEFLRLSNFDIIITYKNITKRNKDDYLYDESSNSIYIFNENCYWVYICKENKYLFEESLEKENIKIEDLIDVMEQIILLNK